MDTRQQLTIGAPVTVRYSSDPELPRDEWPKEPGVLKEDFGDQTAVTDRTWARAHRYAVALDDGRLVFVDPDEVEPA